MVERTDAEDGALLRPVTTLGEPFYVRGPGYFVIERRSVYPSYRADRRPTGTYPETGFEEIGALRGSTTSCFLQADFGLTSVLEA